MTQHIRTVVIGGGQAGLATGHALSERDGDFAIFDADARVGDSWRRRWDSLRLFTPAKYDTLPGLPFPADPDSFPDKDAMADYLAAYAKAFSLPLRQGVSVTKLSRGTQGFALETTAGSFTAERVVIATGSHQKAYTPTLDIDPRIHQLHSSQYHDPRSLPEGPALVVGGGTSGVDIAIELAQTRRTILAGRPTFQIPPAVIRHGGAAYWWFINNVVTRRTPIGKKACAAMLQGHGAPLIRNGIKELAAAGVERMPRLSASPPPEVQTIIWATGYRPDFSWIDFPATDAFGWLTNVRGVTPTPGLYCVGMLAQFGLTSALVGGVGRDAEYVVAHMEKAQ